MINVISLGAGVQSSAMYLMAFRGEIEPMPQYAIFADTGNEPQYVYDHLDYLDSIAGHIIPIIRVGKGNIYESALASLEAGGRFVTMPLYTIGKDKKGDPTQGMMRRQCTKEYKIEPIQKAERELLGVEKGKRVPKGVHIVEWIGISLDEAVRMKPARVAWKRHYYPLVERRLTRYSCEIWLEEHGYRIPQKSACNICPFHRASYWREMKETRPEEWVKVVAFDKAIRRLPRFHDTSFISDQRVPLDEIDMTTQKDHGQQEMGFDAECEGMCGV